MKRPIYKRIWDFLGSRDLSVFIFVMGITYFVILFIFRTTVPQQRVDNISTLLPYQVLYIAFFINLLICEIKWIPAVIRRCRKPEPPVTEDEYDKFRIRTDLPDNDDSLQKLHVYLKKKRYEVLTSNISAGSSRLLHAVRGRLSPIGNVLFHLSFFFFLIGIGVSFVYRFDGTLGITEGHSVSSEDDYLDTVEKETSIMPVLQFTVDKITPELWEKSFLFTELKSEVTYGNNRKGVIRLSQPLRLEGARITMSGIGITPEYVLRDRAGNEIDKGQINLNIFVPGAEDSIQIPSLPYILSVSYYPDLRTDKRGKPVNATMKPNNPYFRIKVNNEKGRLVGEKYLRPGEWMDIAGLQLSFPKMNYNAFFKVVHDIGFIFIWIGYILMCAGLAWKLIFYRKEIVIYRNSENQLSLAAQSDYHNNLFMAEIKSLFRS